MQIGRESILIMTGKYLDARASAICLSSSSNLLESFSSSPDSSCFTKHGSSPPMNAFLLHQLLSTPSFRSPHITYHEILFPPPCSVWGYFKPPFSICSKSKNALTWNARHRHEMSDFLRQSRDLLLALFW